MLHIRLGSILSTLTVFVGLGATVTAAEPDKTILVPALGAVSWSAAPATLPKGTQLVLLSGDPSKAGPFVLRLKFPPNTVIAPHRHATPENVTVLSGNLYHEIGEAIDRSKGENVSAGGFVYLPGMTPHSLWTTDAETIIQVTGTGPFGLLYVNPNDDPSRAK